MIVHMCKYTRTHTHTHTLVERGREERRQSIYVYICVWCDSFVNEEKVNARQYRI